MEFGGGLGGDDRIEGRAIVNEDNPHVGALYFQVGQDSVKSHREGILCGSICLYAN